MQKQTTNNGVDYIAFGTGTRPFVILPGMSVRPVLATADGIPVAFAKFASEYCCYLFETSNLMLPGRTMKNISDLLADAFFEVGIENADIFGVSQGGMLALLLALDHPDLVHALVLGSSIARPNATSTALFREWSILADQGETKKLNRSVFKHIYSDSYRKTHEKAFAVLETQGTPEDLQYFAVSSLLSMTFDVYDRLDAVRCPTLVIGAENDRTLTFAASKELAKKIGCPLHICSGWDHAVYDEMPGYRNIVLDFFKTL